MRALVSLLCAATLALGPVAGNHGRFLFDFSPESVVFRICSDPAPRLLYCFEEREGRVGFSALLRQVKGGDIGPDELVVGGAVVGLLTEDERSALDGAALCDGVRAAAQLAAERLEA